MTKINRKREIKKNQSKKHSLNRTLPYLNDMVKVPIQNKSKKQRTI